MAGIGKPGRSLHGQEVFLPSVTRSAVTSIDDAITRDGNARRVTAASKRAAMDENNRITNTATAQQSKKRAALTNLTNYGNSHAIRNSGSASKSQVVTQAAITKNKNGATVTIGPQTQDLPTSSAVQKRTVPSISKTGHTSCSASKNSESFQNEENGSPGRAEGPFQIKEQANVALDVVESDFSENEAIASLERKTQ
eukprot:c18464_g1_i1 orf=649-1239(+)